MNAKTYYACRINQNIVLFCSNLGAKKKQIQLHGEKVMRGRLIYILGGFFALSGFTSKYFPKRSTGRNVNFQNIFLL